MASFSSPIEFAEHLLKMVAKEELALYAGLDRAAKLIKKTAKSEIGHLQPSVGPFQDWAELADSTKDEKDRLGYKYNDEYNPLERTGELRDSIVDERKGLEAVVGSKSDIMAYQEFGTGTIPPRPVIGPAAFRNKEKIKKIIGIAAITGLTGGSVIHPSLGYDMETE